MNSSCGPLPKCRAVRPVGHTRRLSASAALYVLAYIGAHIAFMPLLVLLLPRRVAHIATAGGGEHLLSLLVLVGGITASFANIIAGRLSDRAMARQGNRRFTVASGLTCLIVTYCALAISYDPLSLTVGVIAFQLAVNLLLAPMGALISDYIPDQAKGQVAGLLNCGLPIATGTVGMIAWVAPIDGLLGFGVTAALVALAVLPLLVMWPFATKAAHAPEAETAASVVGRRLPLRNVMLAWWARFLLQLGATVLTNYLYPYIAILMRGAMATSRLTVDGAVGRLSLCAAVAACCGSVAAGQLSDVLSDRRRLMAFSALLAALALVGFAIAPNWRCLAVAYAAIHLTLGGFFSVEAAFIAEMIASSDKRGRWLGYMNLANTLPAILISTLAMRAGQHTWLASSMMFVLLACASACAVTAVLCLAMTDHPRLAFRRS